MYRKELEADEQQREQEKPFVQQFYVVTDLQTNPMQIERFGDLDDAMSCYQQVPNFHLKALGVEKTPDPLPGSLDIVQCKNGIDTIVEDYKKVPGWDNPYIQNHVVALVAEALKVQDVAVAYEIDDGYFHIQTSDDGYDYTLYSKDFTVMDGGIVETDEYRPVKEVMEEVLAEHGHSVSECGVISAEYLQEQSYRAETQRAEAMKEKLAAEKPAPEASISFYVAECAEFPVMGEFHDNLTLEQALEIYDKIPAERMNGIKSIGFSLEDGSIYSGMFDLMVGGEVQAEVVNQKHMITGEVEAVDRKQKIRDRYKGVDISELEVIPAKIIEDLETSSVIRRVAAYIRVSTDNDEQTSSYELQKNYYTDYIQAQPGWVFVGIYADEGISGTSLEHRKGMQQLIEDCKAGKIDLVLTKSIARFARNIVDCLSVIELLKNLNPPVGVKFEADNIYTLDSNGRMILTILASVAEEESHSKSIIMNWSIDRRFSRGLFLTPALLGYDKDEEGNLVINPEEAQTVKVIYYLYLNGYSLTEIATLLMEYSRKTKLGRVEWNPGTLAGVLANERHCGDVLARKTFTPNFLTHKSKKNNNDRTQYRQKNHHEAIVSREVFNAANHLRASRNYSKKNRPLPVLSVVEDGILRGYVPFDKDWTGFSAEEYREASESVMKEPDVTVTADVKKRLDLTGYEIVRVQYFSTMQNPAMTISNGRLRFNTACLKKFENVEYVELLLNSVERCIAIRPCDKNNPNAIRWGRLKEGRWCASTLGCRGLAKTLFDIMEWDEDLRYRFRGQFLEQGDNKMMLFAFDEPEMIKVEEIVLPPKENTEEDEGETVKKKIYIFPPEWAGTFGQPITSIAQVGILRQEHYAGNWDVFRPATEIEEMNIFTAESLNELLREAEKIMEGWTDYR